MTTTMTARKLMAGYLERHETPHTRITARTVNFDDLARGRKVFVTIYGWTPSPMADSIKLFARQNGFIADFSTRQ